MNKRKIEADIPKTTKAIGQMMIATNVSIIFFTEFILI
jgi:hypothetical protein